MTLLGDEEWSGWSDRDDIARQCAVGNRFVGDMRRSLTVSEHSDARTFTTKHGTVATTSNIHALIGFSLLRWIIFAPLVDFNPLDLFSDR